MPPPTPPPAPKPQPRPHASSNPSRRRISTGRRTGGGGIPGGIGGASPLRGAGGAGENTACTPRAPPTRAPRAALNGRALWRSAHIQNPAHDELAVAARLAPGGEHNPRAAAIGARRAAAAPLPRRKGRATVLRGQGGPQPAAEALRPRCAGAGWRGGAARAAARPARWRAAHGRARFRRRPPAAHRAEEAAAAGGADGMADLLSPLSVDGRRRVSTPLPRRASTATAAELFCPALVVFSGGTAFNSLAGHLRQLTTRVAHVLPVSDDGGSTAEIVRVLGGPAVGDIRSRCLRLADDHGGEVGAARDEGRSAAGWAGGCSALLPPSMRQRAGLGRFRAPLTAVQRRSSPARPSPAPAPRPPRRAPSSGCWRTACRTRARRRPRRSGTRSWRASTACGTA
jgi:hypothetical protein